MLVFVAEVWRASCRAILRVAAYFKVSCHAPLAGTCEQGDASMLNESLNLHLSCL